MAGTVTLTEVTFGSVKKIVFAWTSDASGNADATTAKAYTGQVIGYQQLPDTVTPPTTAYDVKVLDKDGIDVLNNKGIDIPVPGGSYSAGVAGAVVASKLTLAVTNAGNAKKGKTILWIR